MKQDKTMIEYFRFFNTGELVIDWDKKEIHYTINSLNENNINIRIPFSNILSVEKKIGTPTYSFRILIRHLQVTFTDGTNEHILKFMTFSRSIISPQKEQNSYFEKFQKIIKDNFESKKYKKIEDADQVDRLAGKTSKIAVIALVIFLLIVFLCVCSVSFVFTLH